MLGQFRAMSIDPEFAAKGKSFGPQLTDVEWLAIEALYALPPTMTLQELSYSRPYKRQEVSAEVCLWNGCCRGANGDRASFIPRSGRQLHCSADCRAEHEAEECGDSPQTRQFGKDLLNDQAFAMSANGVCYSYKTLGRLIPVQNLPLALGISPKSAIILIFLRGLIRTFDWIRKAVPNSKKREKRVVTESQVDGIHAWCAEKTILEGDWRDAGRCLEELTSLISKKIARARRRQRRVARPRHRPLSADTKARITLAAFLLIGGLKPYAMKDQLYPKQLSGATRRFDSTKKLLRRYREKISSEKNRLQSVSEEKRRLLAAAARDLLSH